MKVIEKTSIVGGQLSRDDSEGTQVPLASISSNEINFFCNQMRRINIPEAQTGKQWPIFLRLITNRMPLGGRIEGAIH